MLDKYSDHTKYSPTSFANGEFGVDVYGFAVAEISVQVLADIRLANPRPDGCEPRHHSRTFGAMEFIGGATQGLRP